MFTEQVGLLDEVPPDPLVEVLRFLLGNCKASLRHNGSLALLGNRAEGATDAVLELENAGNGTTDNLTLPDANGEMPNGWALDVLRGAVRFQGPVIFEQGWAKANANWVNVAGAAPWVSYVDCVLCTDETGTEDQRQRTVRVYLPRSTTRDPNVRTGDIIRYKLTASGKAICDSEVYDGKIGEIRDLGLGEDPTDYPMRGWDLADGGGGTDNLSGDNSILYGYTGAGVYTGTAGTTAVAHSFTATISGNGGTVALTIASAVTGITVNEHTGDTAHVHTMSGSDVAGLLDDHVLSSHTHTVAHNGTDGTGDPGTVDAAYGGGSWTTSSGGGATLSHAGSGSVNTGSTDMVLPHTVNDSGHGHSGSTVASNSIASTLSIGTPTGNRPAGKLITRIQRVS